MKEVAARLPKLAVWGLVFGVLVRVVHYLDNPSFWGDEASLALNVASRSFNELLQPLDYAQIAPIPVLWVERVLWLAGGPDERALRVLPFLAGCGVLFVSAKLARRVLLPDETVVAVGLVAASSFLIRYSTELKPYALDALVAVVLTEAGLDTLRHQSSRGRWIRLVCVGLLATFVSAPGAIVGIGISAAIAFAGLVERKPSVLGGAVICGVCWAATAGVAYRVWYRTVAESAYMQRFWEAAYVRPGDPEMLPRLWGGIEVTLQGLLDWVVLLHLTPVLLVVLLVGFASIGRRERAAGALLLGAPLCVAFVASSFGRYPLSTRTMLFTLPSLAIATAAGLGEIARLVHRRVPSLRPKVFAAAFLIPSTLVAAGGAVLRGKDEEMRPLVARLHTAWRAGDVVYISARSLPAWTYYSTDWHAPDRQRLEWMARIGADQGPAGNAPSRGERRLGEASTLKRPWHQGTEIIGDASGIQVRQLVGPSAVEPDPGWAANEADRIRSESRSRAWILTSNDPKGREEPRLLAALNESGAVLRLDYRVGNSRTTLATFGAGPRGPLLPQR